MLVEMIFSIFPRERVVIEVELVMESVARSLTSLPAGLSTSKSGAVLAIAIARLHAQTFRCELQVVVVSPGKRDREAPDLSGPARPSPCG